jgi:hypothetical protein
MTGILQSASMQFTQEARLKQDAIDRTNDIITQLSTQQKQEQHRLQALRARLQLCQDRTKRIANLKRWLEPQRHMLSVNAGATDLHEKRHIGYADAEGAGVIIKDDDIPYELRQASSHLLRRASDGPSYLTTPLPLDPSTLPPSQISPLLTQISTQFLRHRLETYTHSNAALLNPEPHPIPLPHRTHGLTFIKPQTRLIPIQTAPLQPLPAHFQRLLRKSLQQRFTVPFTPVRGFHEEVLEVDAGPAGPRAVVEEVDC